MQTIYAYSYNPAIATGTNTTGTNWRMAYQQPIMLYKGTANTIKLVVFTSNQRVVNLTNYDVQVQIVDRETEEHYVTRTATITTPTSGVASITFTAEDLRDLQHRFYHIIARLVDPDDGSSIVSGEILYLDDNYGAFTPVTIENAWNYNPTSISTTNGIQDISFTNIGETPDSFTGQASKFLRVNAGANAVEFASFASFDSSIVPNANVTHNLGSNSYRWNGIYANLANIGNLTISGSSIDAGSGNVRLISDTQTFTLTDNSTDPEHQVGDGGFMAFNDDSHPTDGPRFEVWYGNVSRPGDPPGQHSLDIHAAANSYVEFASYDLNSYIGIDSSGPFIQTDWNSAETSEWRFGSNAVMYMPANSVVTSTQTDIQLYLPDDSIQMIFKQPDDSYRTHSFDVSGKVIIDGNVVPNANATYSLGSTTEQWTDLYVSNTIYANSTVVTTAKLFANLPAAATAGAGARGFITDANTRTFASQVSGGGANALPVFSDGTNWFVG